MSAQVKIFEVGPRDGLQSQAQCLSLEQREKLVSKLIKAGLSDIEVGSFVRADRVPQLAHTDKLLRRLQKHKKHKNAPKFWAFVPNQKGMELAAETAVDGVGFFIAASKTFCQKNVNRSQDELLSEIAQMLPVARKNKIKHRVYLSTLSYCPYEGTIAPKKVRALLQKLFDLGVEKVALGDTTGHSTPRALEKVLGDLLQRWPARSFALHAHDTRALALANVFCAMQMGLREFDSSVGGLGGCPYAPGAAGNLATEDLLYFLQKDKMIKQKIDLGSVAQTSRWLERALGYRLPSKVLMSMK